MVSDENCSQKNLTAVSDFFSHDFHHPIFPIAIAGPSNSRYCVSEVTKIVAKKIEEYEVARLFFDIYRRLAKLEDKADQPRSTG